MAATVQRGAGPAPAPADLDASLRNEGLVPHGWSNAPGDRYDWHAHSYHKVLYCVQGSITFHLRDQDDIHLEPGDRLDVEPDTPHAATVGPEGVRCVEAAAS